MYAVKSTRGGDGKRGRGNPTEIPEDNTLIPVDMIQIP